MTLYIVTSYNKIVKLNIITYNPATQNSKEKTRDIPYSRILWQQSFLGWSLGAPQAAQSPQLMEYQ